MELPLSTFGELLVTSAASGRLSRAREGAAEPVKHSARLLQAAVQEAAGMDTRTPQGALVQRGRDVRAVPGLGMRPISAEVVAALGQPEATAFPACAAKGDLVWLAAFQEQ